MNVFQKSLKEGFKAIKKHKVLFISLIVIQLFFIVFLLVVGINYQIKIYQNAQEIMLPLQQANYNSSSLQSGNPLMTDMMKQMVGITKNYQQMIKNISQMLILMLGGFLIFNGLNWSISNYMIKKGSLLKYWGKFIIVSLVFILPISIFGYFFLYNLVGNPNWFSNGIKIVEILFLVLSYFMIIGFCLVDKKFKSLFKKIFVLGVTKAHFILIGFFFVLAAILLSLLFVYYSTGYLSLMILSAIVLVIVLVLGRIYLISLVKNIRSL